MISVTQKGARADIVAQLVKDAIVNKYPGATVTVIRKEPAESRSARFDEAMELISDAKSTGEELKDELQEWKDSLPENLQDGQKASELDEAINQLDSFISSCENVEGESVEFPNMF